MIQINLSWLLRNYDSIKSLVLEAPGEVDDGSAFRFKAMTMSISMQGIFEQSLYSNLFRACRSSAMSLIEDADKLTANDQWGEPLKPYQKTALVSACQDFLKIFEAELQTMPFFLVSRKDAYDTEALIHEPHLLFPKELLQKVPECAHDVLAVGRSLAFELSTGAGFHLFRILESVLRKYWLIASNGKLLPKNPNLGILIGRLENENGSDEKVVQSLKQLKDLHRNPLIHPEVSLSNEEAIGTLGQVRSVVSAMLEFLPDAIIEPVDNSSATK